MFSAILLLAAVRWILDVQPQSWVGDVTPTDVTIDGPLDATAIERFGSVWKFMHWDLPSGVSCSPGVDAKDVTLTANRTNGVKTVHAVFANYSEPQEDEPAYWGCEAHIYTSPSPDVGGKTTPESETFYGYYPMKKSVGIAATPNPGWIFQKWVENGQTVSTSAQTSYPMKMPYGSNIGRTFLTAYFKPVPISVTLYLDGVYQGTKICDYFFNDWSPAFDINVPARANMRFDGIAGHDTIGHQYRGVGQRARFSVDLRGYVPVAPQGYVTCYLTSKFSPYPWSGGGGSPYPSYSKGFVWIYASPKPSDGSMGTVSPENQVKYGATGDSVYFSVEAFPASETNLFVRWEDAAGNVLSTANPYGFSKTVYHAANNGYTEHIYGVFTNKPPNRLYNAAYLTTYLIRQSDDPDVEYLPFGLGGLYYGGEERHNDGSGSSFRDGFDIQPIKVPLSVGWKDEDVDDEGVPTKYEVDPVTLSVGEAAPSNGFDYVWYRYDNPGGYFNADSWYPVAKNTDYKYSVAASNIWENSYDDEWDPDSWNTEGTDFSYWSMPFVWFGVMFEPRFGYKCRDEWSSWAPTYVKWEPESITNEPMFTASSDAKFTIRGTAGTRSEYRVMLKYVEIYGKDDSYGSGYEFSTNLYASCGGPFLEYEFSEELDVPDPLPPLKQRRHQWVTTFRKGQYDTRLMQDAPYFSDDGFIMHGTNGQIMADFMVTP